MAGFTGFVLLRARAHRLLLAAALLTVLLTTAVLATLTAYSGAIGDAALRHSLRDPRNAADTTLVVHTDVPPAGRAATEAAGAAVRERARTAFDGLPVTVRALVRSGPYGLPRSLQPPAQRSGDPDLTYFAALDPTQVRLVTGRLPGRAAADGLEAALPVAAAQRLGLEPGARLALADRLGGPKVHVRITGLYRPVDAGAPYWQLDDLGGRGVRKVNFTTYGPLLADPGVVGGGKVSTGQSAWQASADFSTLTTDRMEALRDAVREGSASLRKTAEVGGTPKVTTSLPEVLDRIDRSLLVARSTLLIAALLLALLAGHALLLVARLLSSERAGETRLLRARGGSRARLAGLAATEALLLAVPAVVCAPLLAGPLTGLLAGQGALARIGLHPDVSATGRVGVWLVAAAVALGCALAVTLPALTSSSAGRRARALPAPLRAGADLGLLAVAAVAYWQLDRQPSGAVNSDRTGTLGIDPLLVTAPALALLAGTVLTLRLLPPVARLAERRATGGRGLPAALAGWQFSRRPTRGAGPVLLLVLAVALGMLAIGQGASWDRSQDDQADFRAGAPVRLLAAGEGDLGSTEQYAAVPHVRAAAPAVRTTLPLAGDRTATVLALDTTRAADVVLMRPDLASGPVRPLLAELAPKSPTAGLKLPAGTTRLGLAVGLKISGTGTSVDMGVTVEDRYGVPYRMPLGTLTTDGRSRTLDLDLPATTEPLVLTGLDLSMLQPADRAEQHRLTVSAVTATGADGTVRHLSLPTAWKAVLAGTGTVSSPDGDTAPTKPVVTSARPLTVAYGTGYLPLEQSWTAASLTLRVQIAQPAQQEIAAVATDRFLDSVGARPGQRVDVTFGGRNVPVRIVRPVRALPTAAVPGQGGSVDAAHDGGGLLMDLRSVNRLLQTRYGDRVAPTEWWLDTDAHRAADVAAALRALPDIDPAQVVVRDEIAGQLRDDPFGAGPAAAFTAAAVVAAALAAVGFAVSVAGSLRERDAEFAVLRALGAPRRQLARTLAAEQGVLVALALMAGVALGTVLTRAVIPLIMLTGQAVKPVPAVLVHLPLGQVAVLLAAVAAAPLVVTAVLALRRADPAVSLRDRGGE
ncbi:peptide ABC transporter permease [Streptomyces sp. NTH33]|uniref:ABC transporter permease n=1 Tax=Streptomyces sp. NTH33 TaxID=1735453 RepID=UPI000DA971FC|nr:ABC transporter permease [Streptomyces sp. NTH33]PZG96462.1 peptide ABC transporter permease [Streptomyces sp. NTH33]